MPISEIIGSGLSASPVAARDDGKIATFKTTNYPVTVERSCEENSFQRFLRSLQEFIFGSSDNTKSGALNETKGIPITEASTFESFPPLDQEGEGEGEVDNIKTAIKVAETVFGFIEGLLIIFCQPPTYANGRHQQPLYFM